MKLINIIFKMETINNNNNIPNQNNSKYQSQPNELFDLTPQPKEPENQLLNNQNFTDEPFLFFLIPFHIDVDFLCGCSLYIGIKLIAFILIFASLFGIYTTLTLPFHIFNTMFSLLITVLYLIAGSAINDNAVKTVIATIISTRVTAFIFILISYSKSIFSVAI